MLRFSAGQGEDRADQFPRVSSEHPGEDCIAKNGPQDRLFGVLKHSRGLGYGECNRSPEENKK